MRVSINMGKLLIILIVISVPIWGCVGGAPHISVDRGPGGTGSEGADENGTGDTGSPAGTSENPFLPPLTENTQIAGGGSALAESVHFKTYGGTAVASGGTATGDRYRSIAQDLSLGAQKIGGRKK